MKTQVERDFTSVLQNKDNAADSEESSKIKLSETSAGSSPNQPDGIYGI